MTNKMVYDLINEVMPFESAWSLDNVGLLVGDKDTEIKNILVCLDITNEVINEAVKMKANLIVSHHPVIFNAIKKVDGILYKLISKNISAICCHTNFDRCESIGVNVAFGKAMGFGNVKASDDKEYFQTTLKESFSTKDFAKYLKSKFPQSKISYSNIKKEIKTVALCSGAGGGALPNLKDDIDAFVTGELKHDLWLDARVKNIPVFALGHYETEKIAVPYMAKYLQDNLSGIKVFESKNEVNPVKYL